MTARLSQPSALVRFGVAFAGARVASELVYSASVDHVRKPNPPHAGLRCARRCFESLAVFAAAHHRRA
jgi:hypothetical protein